MKTMVIYEENGRVLLSRSGGTMPEKVELLVADVPEGQYVQSVNAETGEPVLAALPPSDTEKRLSDLEAQVAAMLGTE